MNLARSVTKFSKVLESQHQGAESVLEKMHWSGFVFAEARGLDLVQEVRDRLKIFFKQKWNMGFVENLPFLRRKLSHSYPISFLTRQQRAP